MQHTDGWPGSDSKDDDRFNMGRGPRASEPFIGMTVGRGHRVVRRIGQGGTARIYEAVSPDGRPVAVKVLLDSLEDRPAAAERFLREAEVIATLSHPNALPLFDVGILADGRPYLITERIVGETLGQRLLDRGRLPELLTVRILRQVADVLRAAHARGIIHRDIKPDNLFIEHEAHDDFHGPWCLARVLDFGLARWAERPALTEAGVVMGSARYMAPEQALGKQVDGRTDLYALGVVAYECLTGAPPFQGPTPTSELIKHVIETPEPLRSKRPTVDDALGALVMKLLSKRPENRPASADEVLSILDAVEDRLCPTESRRTPLTGLLRPVARFAPGTLSRRDTTPLPVVIAPVLTASVAA